SNIVLITTSKYFATAEELRCANQACSVADKKFSDDMLLKSIFVL
ncbi:16502_t:CDS:1, partial [Cetraspora pellucida]